MIIPCVLSGDYEGKLVDTAKEGAYIKLNKHDRLILNSDSVLSYEIVESTENKKLSSTLKRGIAGNFVAGGVGALAGMATTKGEVSYKIKILFTDGKVSLIQADKFVYNKILLQCLNTGSAAINCAASTNTTFCSNCGAALTGAGKFCSSCGYSLETNAVSKPQNEASSSTYISTSSERETTPDYTQSKSVTYDADLSESVKKLKNDLKTNFGRKPFTPKQIKRFFALAVAIAAVAALIMTIVLHPSEDVGINIMMFIFLTPVFSVPLVIGTLLICLPSIRINRKNRGDDE